MLFSICVPVYNAEKFLDRCIKSVLNQSFDDFELILINDGSTDDSAKICDFYSKTDDRIVYLCKTNGGVTSARKMAAGVMRGEYALFIDADDYIDGNYLTTLAKAICSSGADMVAWGYKWVHEDGKPIKSIMNELPAGLYKEETLSKVKDRYLYDRFGEDNNNGNIIYSIWSKAVKKDLYKKEIKRIPDSLTSGEDAALIWLLLRKIQSLMVLSYDGYDYCLNSMSVTNMADKRISDLHTKERRNYIFKKKIIPKQRLEKFFLLNCQNEKELEIIRCFSYCRVDNLLDYGVKNGYRAYKTIIELGEKERIFEQCSLAFIDFKSKCKKIEFYLIRKKKWGVYYLFHKWRQSSLFDLKIHKCFNSRAVSI